MPLARITPVTGFSDRVQTRPRLRVRQQTGDIGRSPGSIVRDQLTLPTFDSAPEVPNLNPQAITQGFSAPIQSTVPSLARSLAALIGSNLSPSQRRPSFNTSTVGGQVATGAVRGADISDPTQLGRALEALKIVESFGGDYTAIGPDNGYDSRGNYIGTAKGAYQVIDSTWNNFGGYPNAAAAPPAVQDAFAEQLLQSYYDRFGSWDLAAVAWHGGPGAAEQVASGRDPYTIVDRAAGTNTGQYLEKFRGAFGSDTGAGPSDSSVAGSSGKAINSTATFDSEWYQRLSSASTEFLPRVNVDGFEFAQWGAQGSYFNPEIIPFIQHIENTFGVRAGSGYRDDATNRRYNGAEDSDHLDGNAVDLSGSYEQMVAAERWINQNLPGTWTWIHDAGSGLHLHVSFREGY